MSSAEYLVIAASLRGGSYSRIMADALNQSYARLGAESALFDLREEPLPFCDGDAAYADPAVGRAGSLIRSARVVMIAAPIYNYAGNSAAKNLIELTGKAWQDKIVGFLCAAGGDSSYMSIMNLANSLMLDFRCVILPRFVYATGGDFADGQIATSAVQQRIDQLAEASLKLRQG